MLDKPVLQLTPFFRVEDEATILPTMKHCVSARWNPLFTDITVKGADKGSALLKLAAHIGLEPSECIAFGDGGNDISMIRAAGVGVAMGNAGDDVKQAANFVTTHIDEDGIMHAMRHLGVV